MSKKELIKKQLSGSTESGENITVTIEGNSSMPFWNHDLKFEAPIALLGTVNEKDFVEDDKWEDYDEYVARVMEALHIPDFR